MNSGKNVEYYILFAVGLIAAIWFFVGYPSQDPRSVADINFEKEEIKLQAADIFTELGFLLNDYEITEVSFSVNRQLLDSLQYRLGRQRAINLLETQDHPNIKPFYWDVVFTRKENPANAQNNQFPVEHDPAELSIRLGESGEFISLDNPSEHLPPKSIQRTALGSVFTSSSDTTEGRAMAAISDSLLNRMLYFDLQKEHENYTDYQRKPEAEVHRSLNRGIPYRHSINDARAIADFYLDKTGWDNTVFALDTVYIQRIGSVNAANVQYSATDSTFNQQLQLDVAVGPAGALLQMNATYNPNQDQQGVPNLGWEFVHLVLILFLILVGIVIFFFRMRSRAIDTQSALMAAVVMGLIVPVSIFLAEIDDINPFSAEATFDESLLLLLQIGIIGAIASISFFILFAISDSITRQHWPQKLSVYDYLQQGMIFNKTVGLMILRGLILAFVLAGFWTLLLTLMPQLYFSIFTVFISEQSAWPPLYLLFTNSWFSFAIVCSIFLVLGSLAYGKTKNKWMAAFAIILACGLLVPFYKSFGSFGYELLQAALFGVLLAAIYIKWDFLTVFLAHFLFLGLAGSASGWIIPNSLDSATFIAYLVILVVLAVFSVMAIALGKDERSVPEYVPSYVEELAQEQRIKQELQIAREVQQSFLPSKIPAYPGLDIAAVCQPAYETGGDYYDFIPLDDYRVAVTIGDVSGKGIQAAFYMTFVKGILHSLCRETDSPAEVLRKANRLFHDNASRGTFVSLIYGVVDLKKKTFTFARAGHNPILHVKTNNGTIDALQPNGLGMGLTRGKIFDNKIQEIELSITEDDLFLFYTDGIVEALNAEHEFYGTDRLIKLVKRQKKESASKIVSIISKGVTRFIGEARQHDDMTLMAIRFGKSER